MVPKWPFGGKPGLAPGTYEEWIKEVPLVERKSGQGGNSIDKMLASVLA